MSVPISAILDRKGREVATATPSMTIADAVAALAQHDVGALVVVDGDRVAGVISERDVVRGSPPPAGWRASASRTS
jgi:CBS domain-containing protein